ncbi:MAG: c-type cytochrome [Gemmatimonadetes bacterium]|nr:c-type cytochrome [Gemmatimonadota bacterium]
MRERIAIGSSILVIAVLVALSAWFAASQNPRRPEVALTAPATAAEAVSTADADSASGRLVFQAQGCERCHSVQGSGSPRSPLDGVGARRSQAELTAWTVAEPAVLDSLSPSVARAKARYRELPANELDDLIRYLARLVTPR